MSRPDKVRPSAILRRPRRRRAQWPRTQTVRAESVWPDLRSQLAAVVEHSNDAIFSRTFDGIITTWNAASTRIFGYGPEELVGKSSRVMLPPGSEDEFRKLVARLRRGQVVEHFETVRLRRDGEPIHVSMTLSPIRDSSRRLIGFSTGARDVTEQKRVQNALARRESELSDLFEQASVGLLVIDPDGIVVRANPAFAVMMEQPRRNLRGTPLKRFFPEAMTLNELRARLARRETLHNLATEFVTAKGRIRFALVDADGLWEEGRLIHTRWFVRDISRRRELERELIEAGERERRSFAQELHDGLGQVLGGAAYLSNVLRERLAEGGATEEAAAAARIFEVLRKAIEDARRMARGMSPVGNEPDGLRDALRDLAAQISELHGIRCRLSNPSPVPVTDLVVANHLYRIAQEAVNNAVKHGRPRLITISLRNSRSQLRLVITDDGKGIGPLSPNRKGLGLRNMQYRATLIRATLGLTARRPRGTCVSCVVRTGDGKRKAK